LYLRLDESPVIESEEVRPGVVLDFNADDQVVGFEILGYSGGCRGRISRRCSSGWRDASGPGWLPL
ncbi:MAG: DUF2283 domain-containing protein, partial [Chloroflexia bacterium]|nr:DUF2283 domain-containing protein [Chloroflexia bacterium]